MPICALMAVVQNRFGIHPLVEGPARHVHPKTTTFCLVLGFTPSGRPTMAHQSQNDLGQLYSRHLCGRCVVQISLDQNHLPRSSASQCTVLGVGVEGAAKSLHLPRLHALQVTPAGVSVEGDFD